MATVRGFSIGKHRVEVSVDPAGFRLAIDEGAPSLVLPAGALGEWPIVVGERKAIVRRVRNLDVARTELWIHGIRLPPSELPLRHRPAKAGTTCARHPSPEGGAYRSGAPPPGHIDCATCREVACRDCTAVDGVRCRACFDAAAAAMRRDERHGRIAAVGVSLLLSIILILLGGAASSRGLLRAGFGCLGLLVFLVFHGLYAERREARRALQRAR